MTDLNKTEEAATRAQAKQEATEAAANQGSPEADAPVDEAELDGIAAGGFVVRAPAPPPPI